MGDDNIVLAATAAEAAIGPDDVYGASAIQCGRGQWIFPQAASHFVMVDGGDGGDGTPACPAIGGIERADRGCVGVVDRHNDGSIRANHWLPAQDAAAVGGAGTVYVVWSDCRFRSRCRQNDIVITHSTNATGTTWATITRVPIDATNSGIDHFIPGLAVNPATSGSTAQLGVTYYFYASGSTSLQVGFLSSTNAGSTWSTPTTIFGGSSAFPTTWVATTSQGRMVGDYISTSYGTDNLAHGVFAVAYVPTTGSGTSCSTTALDNCNEPTDAFATGLSAGTVVAPSGPILSPPPKGGSHKHIWRTHHEEADF
jgi:hypothetical protein